MKKNDATVEAILRLEKWLGGAPDFLLQDDVRLVIEKARVINDALRELDDMLYQNKQLERLYTQLRNDCDELTARLRRDVQ